MQTNWRNHQKLALQEGAKFMQQNIKQFQENQQELKERWQKGMKQMQENMAKGLQGVGGGLGIQFAEKVQELPWFPGSRFSKQKSKFGVVSAAQKRALEQHRTKHTAAVNGTGLNTEYGSDYITEYGSGGETGAMTE